jgi:hypothetical protein
MNTTISTIALVMCSFWENDNFRDRFSGVNHPEISDECFSFK